MQQTIEPQAFGGQQVQDGVSIDPSDFQSPTGMNDTRTDYATLGMALDELRSAMSVSELHGGLCGTLCAGGAKAASGWLSDCIDDAEASDSAVANAHSVFRDLELETWRVLASTELEFMPLLPADDMPLDDRVAELASWCQGFLAGLALGGLQNLASGSANANGEDVDPVEEIVEDFTAISRAGLSSGEENDPDDADFAMAEIVEYVRVGVQIIFEEIGSSRGDASGIPASMSEH
jgi:uncharacterized protein YgfB (UPF0149 family)